MKKPWSVLQTCSGTDRFPDLPQSQHGGLQGMLPDRIHSMFTSGLLPGVPVSS